MGWVTREGTAAAVAVQNCHAHSWKLVDPGSAHVENLGVVVELKNKSDMIVKSEKCALTLSNKLITYVFWEGLLEGGHNCHQTFCITGFWNKQIKLIQYKLSFPPCDSRGQDMNMYFTFLAFSFVLMCTMNILAANFAC